jgi:hypothetical protein
VLVVSVCTLTIQFTVLSLFFINPALTVTNNTTVSTISTTRMILCVMKSNQTWWFRNKPSFE